MVLRLRTHLFPFNRIIAVLSQRALWAPIATSFAQDVLAKTDGVLHRRLEVVNGNEGASLVILLTLCLGQLDSDLEGYFNVSIYFRDLVHRYLPL